MTVSPTANTITAGGAAHAQTHCSDAGGSRECSIALTLRATDQCSYVRHGPTKEVWQEVLWQEGRKRFRKSQQ